MAGRKAGAFATAAAALALAAGGCGGANDSDQIKTAVADYLHALARYDGATACSKLSQAARAPFDRFGHGQTCASLMTAEARQQIVGIGKQRLAAAKVVKVKVIGATAQATVSVPGRTSTIALVREGGSWKIESAGA